MEMVISGSRTNSIIHRYNEWGFGAEFDRGRGEASRWHIQSDTGRLYSWYSFFPLKIINIAMVNKFEVNFLQYYNAWMFLLDWYESYITRICFFPDTLKIYILIISILGRSYPNHDIFHISSRQMIFLFILISSWELRESDNEIWQSLYLLFYWNVITIWEDF